MKKWLLLVAALFAISFVLPAQAHAQSVPSFKATYTLEQSGLIHVLEEITYDFGGEERHGIYRYIPYKYTLDNGETSYLNLSSFSVTDFDGETYEFERSRQNNNVVLKVGDPDRTITGTHDYRISYDVKGGLRYLESGDEFFWNVNGPGWEADIQRISATVILPTEIGTESIELVCYRGAYGESSPCQQRDITGSKATFSDAGLAVSENLSIAVRVPKGSFEIMSAGFMGSGISNAGLLTLVIMAISFPVIAFIFMLQHWWRRGRDPKGRGTIIAEYNAPNNLTPIEVGTLLDNRVDNKDLSAEIIYLATSGLIQIRRLAGKGILRKDDYLLTRMSLGSKLSKHDETMIDGLFGQSEEVLISSLKNKFYSHVQQIKIQVHGKLVADGYFKEAIASTIGKYLVVAFIVGFLGYWIATGIGAVTGGLGTVIFAPAFILSGIIVGLFGLAMPARTAKGVEAKERILGLKEYMSVAESDRLKFHNAPKKDAKRFEELLPYAMVLGVEKEWAKQFEGIYDGSPSWYSDPSGARFMPIVFVNNLNSFSAIATQDMTSMPSSSGSGFGGGGFSGGGFGGGGGGSW